jgi:hypothetical protein
MLNITLYTKQGCGLCDDVKLELDGLAVRYPHRLHEVDISRVPELWERYRLVIPVVRIGEMELQAPISPQALISALDQASPSVATRSGNTL